MSSDDLALETRLKGYIESVKETTIDAEPGQLLDKHLIKDLAMDSLDVMNLLFQIEENEKVEITEADMEANGLYDFGKLAAYIKEKAGAA